jgi:hypothetical protein
MIASERGAILVVALVTLALLSVMGSVAFRVASGEHERVRQEEHEVIAQELADAGVERVLAWFADPSTFTDSPPALPVGPCAAPVRAEEWFRKRCRTVHGLPSFRDADGRAQWGGTINEAAVVYEWLHPLGEWVEPAAERTIPSDRLQVRLFAPTSPDAIATLISSAFVGRATVSIRVELVEGPWSGLTGALRAGEGQVGPFPVRVHWGDIFVEGPLDLRMVWDRLPRHDSAASVSGQPYLVEPGADRWFDVTATGEVLAPMAPSAEGFTDPYRHIRPATAIPPAGVWLYQGLKRYAQQHGRYFTTRGTGLLYPNDQEPGVSLSAVMGSRSSGNSFLFVDTLDQQAPGVDNLDRLHASFDGITADAYIGAHLAIRGGEGRAITVDTPSAEGASSGEPAVSGVVLSGIHYVGALLVAGEIQTENRVSIFGAVVAGQGFRDFGGLEVWYDDRLRHGDRNGFAPVLIKPGSRRRVASEAWESASAS